MTVSIGDAVLFPAKWKSFIWVRVICFGQCWWEMGFPSESIPAYSELWVWMMAQAQWQTHFSSPIWDLRQGDVSFAHISFNDVFLRRPSFLTCLCVEEVSRGQKKNYVKEKIKDDTIIHYIHTHTQKSLPQWEAGEKVQILKRILNGITRKFDSTSRSYLAWFGDTFLNIHISSKNIHWQILEK